MQTVHRQTELLEVVAALGTPGGLASGLHGGQEERDQHSDDADDNQKLDQGERAPAHGPNHDLFSRFDRRATLRKRNVPR
jgi:hypothetical protein